LTVVPTIGTIVPNMSTTTVSTAIHQSLFGRTRTTILSLLYGHPDETYYVRQLVRETRAGNGAIQRELRQLSDAGLIVRKIVGRQVFYHANLKTAGVRDVLRDALAPLKSRIDVAFVYGSIATQKDRADSDVDLMIVGQADLDEIVSSLGNPQKQLRREINPSVYGTTEFRSKVAAGNHFLAGVLRGKKLFVVGNENELRKLSAKRLADEPSKQP
jgi:uncharacterized protein